MKIVNKEFEKIANKMLVGKPEKPKKEAKKVHKSNKQWLKEGAKEGRGADFGGVKIYHV
jgi:hypothetical protein|tara:strand:- start:187 stop:363 length:177 start_codon:yes stop_codon:yes gene_type:complete